MEARFFRRVRELLLARIGQADLTPDSISAGHRPSDPGAVTYTAVGAGAGDVGQSDALDPADPKCALDERPSLIGVEVETGIGDVHTSDLVGGTGRPGCTEYAHICT